MEIVRAMIPERGIQDIVWSKIILEMTHIKNL